MQSAPLEVALPPKPEDSHSTEETGPALGRHGDPKDWSFGKPFELAGETLAARPGYFSGMALAASAVSLIPLGGMLARPLCIYLAVTAARDHLDEPVAGRVSPAGGGLGTLYLLQVMLLVGTFLAGVSVVGSLGVLVGGGALMVTATCGEVGPELGPVLAGLAFLVLFGVAFLVLTAVGYATGFAHEDLILRGSSPAQALWRSLELCRAGGVRLAIFFGFFFGVQMILGFVGHVGIQLALALGSGMAPDGYGLAVSLGVGWVGGFFQHFLEMGFMAAWAFRFLHEGARAGAPEGTP